MLIRQVLISDVQERILPLIREHLKETDKRLPNFDEAEVNLDLYTAMEAQGAFTIFAALDGDNLAGYLALFIHETPHIRGYLQGMADGLFVDKAYRKGSVAVRLIKAAEQYAKDVGCSSLTLCFKADNAHEEFCKSSGFAPDDILYSKRI